MKGKSLSPEDSSRLYELDRTFWLHPQGDLGAPVGTIPQLIIASGSGATLTDVEGREYIDGMASLWNVNVGYGRTELADAAAEQMKALAFSSAYGGFGTAPAIELAAKLAELAPGDLEVTYFASGGAEANDTAYKIARLYWTLRGEPERVNIISRIRDYHGLTYGATSATGLPNFWKGFGPLAPGFLHAPSPDPYRFSGQGSPGVAYVKALEDVVMKVGAHTVAAVVAEPVQGAGGVIVPPADYFPLLREVCDRHGLLLIADEVITGFGRTGRWFGLQHWNVQADLMIFAKGVTSGYLPLSGVMLTRSVHDTLKTAKGPFAHGFTYSGHPTACAVALRNLQILEDERLVERAAERGAYLLKTPPGAPLSRDRGRRPRPRPGRGNRARARPSYEGVLRFFARRCATRLVGRARAGSHRAPPAGRRAGDVPAVCDQRRADRPHRASAGQGDRARGERAQLNPRIASDE